MPSDTTNGQGFSNLDDDLAAAYADQFYQDERAYYDEAYPDNGEEGTRHRGGFTKKSSKKESSARNKASSSSSSSKKLHGNGGSEKNGMDPRHKDGYKKPPVNNQR